MPALLPYFSQRHLIERKEDGTVKFGFLLGLVIKISIFRRIIPISFTHGYQRFGVICCFVFYPEVKTKLQGIAFKFGKVMCTGLLHLATVNYYSNVAQYLIKLQHSSVVTSVPIISTVTVSSTRRISTVITTSTQFRQLRKHLSCLINS
jgi:hypothetical protein